MKKAKTAFLSWKTSWVFWFVVVSLFCIILGTAYLALPAGTRRSGEKYVRVAAGAGARTIGKTLTEEGIIRSATQFVVWTRVLRAEGQLQAGEYKLHAGMMPAQVVWRIKTGQVASMGITIPEGYSLAQIAEVLAVADLVDKEEFLAVVSDATALYAEWEDPCSPVRPPTGSLEGYLFPDTYRIAPGTSPSAIARLMVNRMCEKVLPLLQEQSPPLDLDLHGLLTLASIVEKEAKVPEERPLIAGVFINRLKRGMPLQADPTVKYVLSPAPVRLSLEDIEVDSPYNTYRYPGLPPGPIASPGLDSVRAVLESADTEYLYFVARGDGTHVFSRTFREHQTARRELGATSP